MKKMFCTLAVFCGVLFAVSAQWKTEAGNGGLVITGYTGNNTAITIPATINGAAVVAIGDGAFANTQLTSVTIPASVTSIGNIAFFGTALTSVTLPDSVISIGNSAFFGTALTSVTIPASVTSIGDYAFYMTPLTSVTIPASVTSIGDYAFAATRLTSATIPASVTSIGEGAFVGIRLTSAMIPNSVTSIGSSVVAETPSTSVTIPNSVISIGSSAVAGTPLTSVTSPNSVISIGSSAVAETPLASVTNAVADASAYTVTFNSQGGSAVASQTVAKGYTVPYPAEPIKAGVFFDGWYKEAGCINPCDYGAPVSGPITLYALWLTEDDMIAGEFGEAVPASNIFEVNNDTAWAEVRAAIDNGGNSKNYVIKVTGDFQLAGVSSSTFTSGAIKVLIYAPTNKTISGSGNLLYAGASQTLILRNITLQGAAMSSTNAHLLMRQGAVITKNTSGSGVSVDGGTFTMSGGTISGNTASFSDGGGVSVDGGTFVMSGGSISGNTAAFSGGVHVYFGGTFTMSGGTISGNTASSGYGGGVSADGGTFTMSGGTISGNTASSSNSGGVYVISGSTFSMRGGTIYGREAGAGLANTGSPGASLALEGAVAIAKYGSGSDILESGLATDETLVGHD